MIKHTLAGVLGACLFASGTLSSAATADAARVMDMEGSAKSGVAGSTADVRIPGITINGSKLDLNLSPYTKKGRVMVPLKSVAEGMGAKVTWDQAAHTATVTRGSYHVRMTLGSADALQNGSEVTMDAPAELRSGRIYIPLRFSAESLGGTVTWNAAEMTAAISLPLASDVARDVIQEQADKTLTALKDKDGATLATISSQKGVRFSPYGFVDVKNDRVLSQKAITTAFSDRATYLWGSYDGTGEPIKLTFTQYYDKFIYSSDFAAAPQISYNRTIGTGNTLINTHKVYPNAIIVEYHYDGFNPQYSGMDWQSLRLVFGKEGGQWLLMGIIHDQWTI